MSKPFGIKFDFPVVDSNLNIAIRATAEIHHSEPYYKVHNFSLERDAANDRAPSILPDQEVKYIFKNGKGIWVHKDSERESLLSIAIGEGIELALKSTGKKLNE